MASYKDAIREKCKQCTYDQFAPGTYLQQIEGCTVKSCPLWEVRPRSIATITMHRKANAEMDAKIDSVLDSLPEEV